MDRLERVDNSTESFIKAVQGERADIWTAMPGIIESVNFEECTCSVQPAIRARLTDSKTGDSDWIDLPLLIDCPLFFPSGSNCLFTFPVAKGDECLIVFASRCIDSWWAEGGIQNQHQLRMHDLSDGFVFVGFRSLKNIPPDIRDDVAQLRSFDGETYIELDATGKLVNVVAPNGMSIKTPNITIEGLDGGTCDITHSGDVNQDGKYDMTGKLTSDDDVVAGSNSVSLVNHVHIGVTPGSGVTGVPQ